MHTVTGNLFIVSAPSGAGKSSLLRTLLKRYLGLKVAVSHTTRAPRPGERDGVHYNFVDHATFLDMVEQCEFLEHAQVFDNFYGTAEATVRETLHRGHNLILEIDWQGARQVRRRFPDACGIFIIPPSLEALRQRLTNRAQDSAAVIARRMKDAQQELSHYPEYDYLIINDDFERALEELHSIITAHDLQINRQTSRLTAMLRNLLADPTANS